MSSEWEYAPLGEVCSRITYGFTNPMPTIDGEGAYMVTAKDIKNGRIQYQTARKTSWDAYRDNLTDKSRPSKGDLLLTKDGSIGRLALCDRDDICINQSVALLQSNGKADSRYIKYLLEAPEYQRKMESDSDGSTIKHIYITRVDKMMIPLPPRKEQEGIVSILGTLDDKIELNRKTNETLAAMAKALFKSWFVDFDPVKAKTEGCPTGLPDEISNLFPDSFDDSELGEIPNGWRVRRLRDFISPVKDRQGDRNIEEYSATVTGIEPRDSRFKKNLSRSGDKNKVALEGDLVFGLSRRTINFGRMAQPIGAFSSVYEVFRSTPDSTISTKIIEEYIRSRMSEFMVILKPAAREGQAIDREVLMDQPIVDFPKQLSNRLETLLEPVSKKLELISKNTVALEELRDSLLPKLISGEIRIPDAEKMLEEVGV